MELPLCLLVLAETCVRVCWCELLRSVLLGWCLWEVDVRKFMKALKF